MSRYPALPKWSADGAKVLCGERYWEGSGPLTIYDVATGTRQQAAADGGIDLFYWALSGKAFFAGQGSYVVCTPSGPSSLRREQTSPSP
ncbi:MAG: hypothetical protein ACYC6I_04475 [Bacillota bacterium]